MWEDKGLLRLPESEPSTEGLDLLAYSARQKALTTQREEGRRPIRPIVGPTGTFIIPKDEDDNSSARPVQVKLGQSPAQSSPPPDGVLLGPNGTHLIDEEEARARLGPNGTHLNP